MVNARARGLKSGSARPRTAGMNATPLTDAELSLVADVASREGWTDLAAPPERHDPRSLAEELAVARFRAAVPRGPRGARTTLLRARIAVAVLAVMVLGACWWVSPTRTAIGLFGAGLFCLIALRRRNRPRRRPAHPLAARRAG